LKNYLAVLTVAVLTAALLTSCGEVPSSPPPNQSSPPVETPSEGEPAPAAAVPGEMRDITVTEFVAEMGIGINIGNTLEACGDWIAPDIASFETAWGSPIIEEDMIAGYAEAGFKSVRIPVAWSNLMAEDYTIHQPLMDRVQQFVDWVIKYDMTALVNIHWDGGWWEGFQDERKDDCMAKYKAIWTQICERFKDYGDRLMLESLNEELAFDQLWNRYGGTEGKDTAYGLANEINQIFVDLVRSSGGNNEKRFLLIAGYSTDIALTCDPMFKMPDDPQNRCAVSVHYYTPSTFAILEENASWGRLRPTWGTDSDIAELNANMDLMKTTFADEGIPVIFGEYGASRGGKEPGEVNEYILAVCKAVYERGMCPMLWDTTGSGGYDRLLRGFLDPELGKAFSDIAAQS
jgi:endoglucanase